ncbi:SprT-like domain-containing protein [Winogradskyella sp. 3972H.M.0a.05]|uniref:SprT-like domain-containing protein n=1 Tax=Winogradskyella sp. 3972H.M.0a.05 TaxID=2950277 RepID=UPI00339AF372
MPNAIEEYIPEGAQEIITRLLKQDKLIVKVRKERKSKHGDYRQLPNGMHQITVNNNLNKYRFLITLIHEIAHFEAYKEYGRFIKPHGKEWKHTFQRLMLPFLNPNVFPMDVLPLLANHFKNPKASSDTDIKLALALKQFDPPNDKTYIFEVPIDSEFKLYNGRIFKKGKQRRKRFECIEVNTGRLYLFNPNAEVEIINS